MRIPIFAFVLFLFWSALSCSAQDSPVFTTGHPSEQSFETWVDGYGALSPDLAHVAAYVSTGGRVRTGSPANVRLESLNSGSIRLSGTVSDLNPDVDPRTGQSIVTVRIPSQNLPARTYATVKIQISSRQALAVPTDAVLIEDGKPYAFRKGEKNDFDKVPIAIGQQNPTFTEVRSGLTAADTVLVQGALEWEANENGGGEKGD